MKSPVDCIINVPYPIQFKMSLFLQFQGTTAREISYGKREVGGFYNFFFLLSQLYNYYHVTLPRSIAKMREIGGKDLT